MLKRVAVFDFDDTLTLGTERRKQELFAEIFHDISGAEALARRFVLAHAGLPRREMVQGILKALGEKGLVENPSSLFDGYHARFSQMAENVAVMAPLRPGADDVLRQVSDDMPTYVNSANPQAILERIVARRGWAGVLKGAYGIPPGTKETNLAAIIEREAVEPSRVVVIGDGESDRRSAAVYGCRFIGIRGETSSFVPGSFPILEDLRELPTTIKTILSTSV